MEVNLFRAVVMLKKGGVYIVTIKNIARGLRNDILKYLIKTQYQNIEKTDINYKQTFWHSQKTKYMTTVSSNNQFNSETSIAGFIIFSLNFAVSQK